MIFRYHIPAPVALGASGTLPAPVGTLINGLGRFSNGPTDAPLAVVNVVRGTRYRFRLVSISCRPNFNFSIDGHNLVCLDCPTRLAA